MTDLLDPEVCRKAAKREGIILASVIGGLLLAAGTIAVSLDRGDGESIVTNIDEGIIVACTFETAPPFIITDQDRRKCEGGIITVWKKALTVQYSKSAEDAAWRKAKEDNPSLTEQQRAIFMMRWRDAKLHQEANR